MSKVDMAQFGLKDISYHFVGNIRYFQREDGKRFNCPTKPEQMSAKKLDELIAFLAIPETEVLPALVDMCDALKQETPATQHGTSKHVDVTWENVVERNKAGIETGINYDVLGKLMAPDYIRVDDFLMKPEHNIAKPVTNAALTTETITRLANIGAAQLWGTRSHTLVQDHILANCAIKKLGSTVGFLPVTNGIIDLRTMELTQKDDVYLSSANVDYDPDAKCPNIEKLLTNMFTPSQKEMALSIIGAAISGRSAQYILCMSGQGRNGKSLMREMLSTMLGALFTGEKIENINTMFTNQAFLGCRVIWQTEVSSTRKFTTVLKDVTGGTTLNIQYKYKNGGLKAELQSVVIIDTNHPPSLEQSKAIEERLRFIDMPRTFVHELSGAPNEVLIDRDLAESWKTELSGFLNLLLPYSQYFVCNGKLKYDMGGGLVEYNSKADSLGSFIRDACDVGVGQEVSTTTFCKHFRKYAEQHNVSALTDSQIKYQLKKEFDFRVQGMTVYGVRPKATWQRVIALDGEDL